MKARSRNEQFVSLVWMPCLAWKNDWLLNRKGLDTYFGMQPEFRFSIITLLPPGRAGRRALLRAMPCFCSCQSSLHRRGGDGGEFEK